MEEGFASSHHPLQSSRELEGKVKLLMDKVKKLKQSSKTLKEENKVGR